MRNQNGGPQTNPKKKDEKKKKRRRWWCFKGREEDTLEGDLKTDEKDMRTSLLGDASSDEQQEEYEVDETKEQPTEKPRDSDYYSSDESTDYSYSYQYDKSPQETQTEPPPRSFKDVEKQEMPDYASMESFREDFAERLSGECVCVDDEEPETFYRASILPAKKSVGTILSGTTFDESRKQRHIDFIGVSSSSSSDARRKPLKRIRREEEIPLIRADPSLCLCSDSDDSDLVEKEVPAILLPRSTTSTTTDKIRSLDSTSSDDDTDEAAHPDLDPEVKDDLRYVHMLVPQLDLSELTESRPSSKKSYAEDLFSHVSYEEVSESPPTSSSSQQLYSSTNISSIKKNLLNIPDKQEEQMKKDLVDKGTNTEEKEKNTAQRKTDTDELPLYSTGKEVVELKSYNYSGDKWDALSTSLSSSALVGQDTSDSPPNLTSSEEEDGEKRVRGGYIPLNELSNSPRRRTAKRLITKDLLSKYFVSIEDLTPTRDCGPMTTAKTLRSNSESYRKGEVNVESEKIQREDSRNSKDQKSQTFPSPILKHKSSSGKNLVTIKEPTVDSNISLPGAIQPESSDTATMNPPESQYNHKKMETDRQPVRDKTVSVPCKILLTSDKTQQTSDDDVRRQPSDTNAYSGGYSNRATVGSYTTSDSTRARTPNLCNKRTSTFIEATENIQASSSSNIYECQCPEPRIADTERCGRCGRRPASSPRYGEYANLKEKCYRNMSPTPEVCTKYPDRQYRCVKGTSSEHTVRSKARSKICKNYPTDDSFSICESQCKGTKVPQEAYSSERSSRSRPLDTDCSGRRTRSPGNAMSTSEEYECCMRSRKPRPVSNPPYRCPPPEFESDSSEFSDVPDEDDYYEDHTKRFDLPYQNSDDYLELVQELEETLQSRNRNRVRRAMQEFEHRSRCNKPLDQPILNYDETSESEEPIIEKLTQLTSERRRCCGGKCAPAGGVRLAASGRAATARGGRGRSLGLGGYSGRSRPPDPCIKTRWQLDKNSGEWYKVTEVPQRCLGGRRSRTPSPRRDYCPHNCKCCGSKRHNYR
ncbi:hypothetical protein NQ318_008555 [Aromia moschata]|uniref:Uncharacterized protein n=1 Tax=Aromia moschata TaxID=1265417 RepID=A0AAV8YVT5_9CUCU|nr:hypothetical protein NQ318_008555 [Aromia moschata]